MLGGRTNPPFFFDKKSIGGDTYAEELFSTQSGQL